MRLHPQFVPLRCTHSSRPRTSGFAKAIPHRTPVDAATSLAAELIGQERQGSPTLRADAVCDRRFQTFARSIWVLNSQERILGKHFRDLHALDFPVWGVHAHALYARLVPSARICRVTQQRDGYRKDKEEGFQRNVKPTLVYRNKRRAAEFTQPRLDCCRSGQAPKASTCRTFDTWRNRHMTLYAELTA